MATSEVPKPSQKCMLPDVAPPPHRSSNGAPKSSRFLSVLPALCCAFMLYSSFTAIVDSHGDPATVFFVVSSLAILGLLYLSMRQFERAVAENEGARRDRLKLFIWLLAILLNLLFSYRVTSILQSPIMTGVIWAIAAATSLVGFYLLFSLPQKSTANDESHQSLTADPEGGE